MSMRVKVAIVAAAGLVMGILVILHTPGLTGPDFWHWGWRRMHAWPLYGLMALALVPLLVGQLLYRANSRWRIVLALGLAMLTCYGMKLASVAVHTHQLSLGIVADIVQHRDITSYYVDAAALNSLMPVREWLGQFPEIMPGLSLHSQTKPPGPILYYTIFIKMMGATEHTALIAGLVLGAIATLSIPATYLLLRRLARDTDAAMYGAITLALAPGFVLFFPMLDPAYIMLSSALVGTWVAAVERSSWRFAVLLGAVLALTLLITFNVLVIGFFMAMYPLVVMPDRSRARLLQTIRLAAIALFSAIVLLSVIRAVTGYDALETFASAWRNQHLLLQRHAETRPYPQTIPFDLTDFALGAGWVPVALALLFLTDPMSRRDSLQMRLALLCIAQPLLVAITGLLQMETARVWNFMLPLLLLPVGLELRKWPAGVRLVAWSALWFATVAIAQNIRFIY